MVRILGALVVLQVAGDAGGSRKVVVVVDVAVQANPRRIGVGVCEGEAHCCVIKGRWLPRASGMALLAGLCEAAGDVVWILRALVVR